MDLRSIFFRALAIALLFWSATTFAMQLREAIAGREQHPGLYPNGWILGGPQVEPLRTFLAQIEAELPDDARVVVESSVYDWNQHHYLEMWAAYYLPRQRVTRHRDLPVEGPVFRLAYPGREVANDAELVFRDARASLERVRSP